MNTRLKRIEATLHDLGNRQTTGTNIEMVNHTNQKSEKESVSFLITPSATNPTQTEADITEQAKTEEPKHSPAIATGEQHDSAVAAFSLGDSEIKAPNLPKFKTPSFTSHRNAANPALAANMLQEIQQIVGGWQSELQAIIRQIQDIYIEGPIVNGWLESYKSQSETKTDENPKNPIPGGTATLRHGEVDQLMDYVEELCAQSSEPKKETKKDAKVTTNPAGYRLCGLDDSGKMWSRPCPAEQVAGISMAIARYQKLRQLLGRKQYLEFRLNQLAETLVMLHSHIKGE